VKRSLRRSTTDRSRCATTQHPASAHGAPANAGGAPIFELTCCARVSRSKIRRGEPRTAGRKRERSTEPQKGTRDAKRTMRDRAIMDSVDENHFPFVAPSGASSRPTHPTSSIKYPASRHIQPFATIHRPVLSPTMFNTPENSGTCQCTRATIHHRFVAENRVSPKARDSNLLPFNGLAAAACSGEIQNPKNPERQTLSSRRAPRESDKTTGDCPLR